MGNEPSDIDISDFEQSIGKRFLPQFRAFIMSSLGGLYMNVLEEVWPQAKQYDVGSFCRGIIVYAIATDILFSPVL